MIEMLVNNVFSFIFGCSISAIAFWFGVKSRFEQIHKRLSNLEKSVEDIKIRYEQGYVPYLLCETCHKGRYSYHGYFKEGFNTSESWICDSCGEQAPMSWKNRNALRK